MLFVNFGTESVNLPKSICYQADQIFATARIVDFSCSSFTIESANKKCFNDDRLGRIFTERGTLASAI